MVGPLRGVAEGGGVKARKLRKKNFFEAPKKRINTKLNLEGVEPGLSEGGGGVVKRLATRKNNFFLKFN